MSNIFSQLLRVKNDLRQENYVGYLSYIFERFDQKVGQIIVQSMLFLSFIQIFATFAGKNVSLIPNNMAKTLVT